MKLTQRQIAHIKTLEDQRGVLTPSIVVADAKNKRSPLHAIFPWDVKKAAMAHWLAIARDVIGSVEVMVTNETMTIRSPVYIRDPEAAGDQGYRSIHALRSDPQQAREALIYTLRTAAGHVQRARDIALPLGLSNEVDVLIETILGLVKSLSSQAA
jgi:hypothetical protein